MLGTEHGYSAKAIGILFSYNSADMLSSLCVLIKFILINFDLIHVKVLHMPACPDLTKLVILAFLFLSAI